MSKGICSGIFIILLISYICDSAILIRTTAQTKSKSLAKSSPEYLIPKKENTLFFSDFCANKNKTANGQSNFTRIHCSAIRGRSFPLDLTEDYYLHLKNTNQYIAPGKYCITKRNTAKLCPYSHSSINSSPPPPHFTWRKCCPQNQLLHVTNSDTCINSRVPFRLSVDHEKSSFSVVNTHQINFKCPIGHSLKKYSTHPCASQSMTRFQFSPKNGTIQYETTMGVFLRKSEWKTVDPSSNLYCLDGVVTSPTSNCNNAPTPTTTATNFQKKQQRLVADVEINENGKGWPNKWDDDDYGDSSNEASNFYSNCSSNNIKDDGKNNDRQHQKMTSILYVCVQDDHTSPEPSSENISTKTTVLAFIWLLTCPLLLGAALGNCCIIQKNIHGWILFCYLISMFILNILSAILIVKVGRNQLEEGCQPIDFVIKFMYMSTLCWMSSINFGLHKTFRYTLPQPVGCRRFIASVIFSLGFPAISVTVSYYVAHLSIDQSCGDLAYCKLYSPITIPFYSVPMLLLVLGNFAIFLKTSYTITTLRKEAEDILQVQAQDHLKSFTLFAKLFLLTGCIWLLRLVLFILQIKGLYLSWYGVMLETFFSVPEVVFPMIVFHHPEFIKWCWNTAPVVSNFIFKLNPLFHVPSPTK